MARVITVHDLHHTYEPLTFDLADALDALRPWFAPWGGCYLDVAGEFAAAVAAGDGELAAELAGQLGIGWEDALQPD
jgi:hypothetical protein